MATVYMAYASQSEKGTANGTKGDSTGNEVVKKQWYNKNWDWMAIYPDEDVREKIAAKAEAGAANDNVGYGQSDRNTFNTEAKKTGYNISKIVTPCNCDCSSYVNVCSVAAGVGTYGSNGWTTSTLKTKLKALGYVFVTKSAYLTSSAYCVRGAIYCKEGVHTVIGVTNGSKYKTTLEAAGLSTSSLSSTTTSTSTTTTSSASTSDSKPSYTVGKTYTTQVDKLRVRKGAGTNYGVKTYSALKEDAKKHAYSNGTLKKGTKVTCKGKKSVDDDIWIQIPSGWVAAYYNGKTYVG